MESQYADAQLTPTNSTPILDSVLEHYTRHVRVGDSEAWFGLRLVTVITRPFTPGEDAIAAWVRVQDGCELLALLHLNDGRDYVVLQRTYTLQTYQDALQEARRYGPKI